MFVARDKDNSLYLYQFKPTRQLDTWYDWDDGDRSGIIELDENCFTNLKWQDEPIEVITVDKGEFLKFIDKLTKDKKRENDDTRKS